MINIKRKLLLILLILLINITPSFSALAYDSGVIGGSDSNVNGTTTVNKEKGLIINFDESPTIRVTAVDKNGEKYKNSYSVDYYTKKLSSDKYYTGYKTNDDRTTTSLKLKKEIASFFDLSTTDTYTNGDVASKIKSTLETKTNKEMLEFFKNDLNISESEVTNAIKNKNLFLIIEPVFQIYDGSKYVTGTSSEIIKYLYTLKDKGTYLYNIHYGGTLELMGKGLDIYSSKELDYIKTKDFKKNLNSASRKVITEWTQETANIMQASNNAYGMLIYYVGDLNIDIPDPDNPPSDSSNYYICTSLQKACLNNSEIQMDGIVFARNSAKVSDEISDDNCIYNNTKYQYPGTNSYCTIKMSTTMSNVLNKLNSVKLGQFVGVTSKPSVLAVWQCFSKTEEERNTIIKSLNENKMPDIKYSFLGSNYTYKNTTINTLYESNTEDKTDYNDNYYKVTKTIRYGYNYESKYLNKWVDKESGKGSGNSITKPISTNEYSINKRDINFEVPFNKLIIGENEVNITLDLSSNTLSNYLKQLGEQNTVNKTINNKKITFYNTNSFYGNSTYKCPVNVNVTDEDKIYDLVFRPIDLSNPFPGMTGEGRTPGKNWTSELMGKYITSRQDVYNKTPLYSVTLTPSIIKEIRKYNKNNDYGNVSTLQCDDTGNSCYSTFLRNNFEKIVNINKSLCYNKDSMTSSAFDSCVVYENRK